MGLLTDLQQAGISYRQTPPGHWCCKRLRVMRPKFKKHTSKRKRRAVEAMLEAFEREHGANIRMVVDQTVCNAFMFGESRVTMTWDNDEISFQRSKRCRSLTGPNQLNMW